MLPHSLGEGNFPLDLPIDTLLGPIHPSTTSLSSNEEKNQISSNRDQRDILHKTIALNRLKTPSNSLASANSEPISSYFNNATHISEHSGHSLVSRPEFGIDSEVLVSQEPIAFPPTPPPRQLPPLGAVPRSTETRFFSSVRKSKDRALDLPQESFTKYMGNLPFLVLR
ncbi:unnamed protein product [Protopolystoma xenopodis]|uniref:Uncharacterized protein n=1 Tax=Protopolystoma xenopodis TaxID=117903 RepID=A0A3S5CL81_9PLAT|nr:unnamed protein product [Protopolystoma xenopodis]